MLAYLARRVLAMVPALLGIILVTCGIMSLAPGDPVSTRLIAGAGGGEGTSVARERRAGTVRTREQVLGKVRDERAVLVWSTAEPEARVDGTPVIAPAGRLAADTAWAVRLASSADARRAWAAGEDRVIRELDAKTGAVMAELTGPEQGILALAVSPAGARLAAADGAGRVHVWDVSTGRSVLVAPVAAVPVRGVAFLPGERLIAGSDDGNLTILDGHGRVAEQIVAHAGAIRSLLVSGDGATAWSSGSDRVVREWDLLTSAVRRIAWEGALANDMAISPDGTWLALATEDRPVVLVPVAGGEPAVLGGHFEAATAIAFMPDGRALFSGGRDEIVRRWSVEARAMTGQTAQAIGPIAALHVLSDGSALLSASRAVVTVPVAERTAQWLGRLARLDFGRSFTDDRPVMRRVGEALPITLLLSALAVAVMVAAAVPPGVLAAARRSADLDLAPFLAHVVTCAVASFWLATLLIRTFSSRTVWDVFPAAGLLSHGHEDLSYVAWLLDALRRLALPLIVMAGVGFASLSARARTSMIETIGSDAVRAAAAKGLSDRAVAWTLACRNSLVTMLTLAGVLLPAMIAGSVIVESIFSINGMGKLAFESILSRDTPVLVAIATCSALLTLAGFLLSDVLHAIVDPRITHARAAGPRER